MVAEAEAIAGDRVQPRIGLVGVDLAALEPDGHQPPGMRGRPGDRGGVMPDCTGYKVEVTRERFALAPCSAIAPLAL